MSDTASFREATAMRGPIKSLGLRIEGTRLEPVLEAFRAELRQAGITRLVPRFYLSTEWGVPFETVAIAIPFYLADDRLVRLHEASSGHVEGTDEADILRYLRHEMGHVACYAYRLYERAEWIALFGSMEAPYEEHYVPMPFSRRHVQHLPGWYAQKHPDEDFAETFAVWMTPGRAWRHEYEHWPGALRKLQWCDAVMSELRDVDPLVTDETLDEDVGEIESTLEDLYGGAEVGDGSALLHLDLCLRTALEALPAGGEPRDAAELIDRLRPALQSEVYRWTGHVPERTRALLRHLARRAREIGLRYGSRSETAAIVALTALTSSLASSWMSRGDYAPSDES